MSNLIDEFLRGGNRVTTHIFYYVPLREGQEPLTLKPSLIGEKPQRLNHAGIIQEYIYQVDDRSDLDDGLSDVFNTVMESSHGMIKVLDRSQRMSYMGVEDQIAPQRATAQGRSLESDMVVPVPHIIIPRKSEEASGAMREITQAFKTLIPFPKVRNFLQFWQDEIDGPLNHIRFSSGSMANGDISYRSDFQM